MALEFYLETTSEGRGIFKEKGSRFLGFAFPVRNVEEIKERLAGLKKEYFDARHHCYAWILGPEKLQFRAFDDGEPNHSAGDPILGQIKSRNLTNTLVVVVRYFGGTKLGVSGLIQAYKSAASEALDASKTTEKFITQAFQIEFAYNNTSVVMAMLKKHDAEIQSQRFDVVCKIQAAVRVKFVDNFTSELQTLAAKNQISTYCAVPG